MAQPVSRPPGHTAGHQSVVVSHDDGTTDLIVGDAAYTTAIWNEPRYWWSTVDRLKALGASRVHFCHDPIVL